MKLEQVKIRIKTEKKTKNSKIIRLQVSPNREEM